MAGRSPAALASRAFWTAREAEPAARAQVFRARREVFLARLRTRAAWYRVPLELDVAPDVEIGRNVTLELKPGVPARLVMERGVQLGDDVRLQLRGGSVHLEPLAQVRHHTMLNVYGEFHAGFRSITGFYNAIHCAERVVIEDLAGLAERVTVSDNSHYYTEPLAWFYENTRTAPVTIGANTWVCPNAVVTKGVTVGDHCIVAAASVVTRDAPAGSLVSGVPATNRPLGLPWEQSLALAQSGTVTSLRP
jgi:acetyltransferase-like isoleucine patch superfamily enzyme